MLLLPCIDCNVSVVAIASTDQEAQGGIFAGRVSFLTFTYVPQMQWLNMKWLLAFFLNVRFQELQNALFVRTIRQERVFVQFLTWRQNDSFPQRRTSSADYVPALKGEKVLPWCAEPRDCKVGRLIWLTWWLFLEYPLLVSLSLSPCQESSPAARYTVDL